MSSFDKQPSSLASAISQYPPVIFLMGPTAAGKTDLAIDLCEHLPCDIVSVDSALIYKGLDIGTAKPSAEELALAPHRLINIRDPGESYSASEFRSDALREMSDITAKGRIPLLVGGTMLYFKVLMEGMADMPAADSDIRAKIEQDAQQHGWPFVHKQLAEVDPVSAARINPNDPQRLQRALEVYRISGKSMTELRREQHVASSSNMESNGQHSGMRRAQDFHYHPIQFARSFRNRQLLHDRIALRFRMMIEGGFIDEVKGLFDRGDLNKDLPAIRSVGYRQAWEYLAGELTHEEMIERGIIATRQLAKRQLTWLRRWPELNWLYGDDYSSSQDASRLILEQALDRIHQVLPLKML